GAQHQEVPDEPGGERDGRAAEEGVLHERSGHAGAPAGTSRRVSGVPTYPADAIGGAQKPIGEGEEDPANSATQTVSSPNATERTMLRTGRAVISCAVAGGSTSRAKTSSAPVIWPASAAAAPSSRRNTVSSARDGTPLARATSVSTDANSSGR